MSRNSEKEFDRARDDLFSHIHRCGVLRAEQDQQSAWLDDTVEYMAECYPSLTREELGELRTIGLRFCSPVISNVQSEEVPADEAVEVEEAVEEAAGTEAAAV